jgi:hypothetical protein
VPRGAPCRLPLRIHAAGLGSSAGRHIAQIEPGEAVELPFSLGAVGGGPSVKAMLSTWQVQRRGQLKQSRTALNLLLKAAKTSPGASDGLRAAAATHIGRLWRGKRGAGRLNLSRPFSVVEIGTQHVVQLAGGGGESLPWASNAISRTQCLCATHDLPLESRHPQGACTTCACTRAG